MRQLSPGPAGRLFAGDRKLRNSWLLGPVKRGPLVRGGQDGQVFDEIGVCDGNVFLLSEYETNHRPSFH